MSPESPYLTVCDIRNWIMERTIQDNDIDFDLVFSDEEILFAMQSAAREYNSTPPLVDAVTAAQMPKTTNMFFDATAGMLYTHFLGKLARNDMEYNAGGVTTRIEGRRIDHFKDLIRLHMDRFREAAHAEKMRKQFRRGFGIIR